MSDRALDRGAQLAYLGVEFLLPVKQLPALRLLKRGNEVRALIALVADPAEGRRNDICGLRFGEGRHVVIMLGNRLGHEEEIAPEARDGPRPFQDRFEGLDHDSRLRCCDLIMSGRVGQGI